MSSRAHCRSVRGPTDPNNLRRTLRRGELVRVLYRLGRQSASGMLTISPRLTHPERGEIFVLRRGNVVTSDSLREGGELARRTLVGRLARLASLDELTVVFDGGVAASPPGAPHHVALASWARQHLEHQLDGSLAEQLIQELAGIRLSIRAELAPEATDESDRRMLIAMAQPRRLDQIWPLARTPRFRLLAFLHFLRAVDALVVEGIAAERSLPVRTPDPYLSAARRLLGVRDDDGLDTVKRAYRRLARALHPDLQPEVDGDRRRMLERRFAEITAAYQALQ